MTTARQQAQEACYEHRMKVSRREPVDSSPEGYADVASAVWEPLLREAWETIHHERCSTLLHTPERGLHGRQCWTIGVALGEFPADVLVKDS